VIFWIAAQCVLAAQTSSRADEYANRAQAEIASNQPEAAVADLNQLLKLRPNDVNGLAGLGMVEFTRGRYAEAEMQFRRALSLSPSLWNARAFLGMCEIRHGEANAGAADIERSLSHLSDPTLRTQAGLELVNSYWSGGNNTDASRILSVLLASTPNNPNVLFAAYRIHSALASAALQQLSQVASDSALLHEVLADSLMAQEDYSRAITEHEAALQRDPHVPGAHLGIGQAMLAQGNTTENLHKAEAEFMEELTIDPQSADCFYQLGQIAYARGNAASAEKLYERSVSQRPHFAEAHVALAKIASGRNDDKHALAELETAIRDAPSNKTAHYRLAQLYKRMGRTAEAEGEFEIARRLSAVESRAMPVSR
jgi:tetratricopeptide (TPR) repeat protein